MFKRINGDIKCIYYNSTKLSNKQVACIFFYKEHMNGYDEYGVGFAIGKSRKQIFKNFVGTNNGVGNYLHLKSTGHCGIEGLLWAKNQIIEFENWIKDNSLNNLKIIIGADDKRRYKVYKYSLEKLGYKESWECGYGNCLVKKITV